MDINRKIAAMWDAGLSGLDVARELEMTRNMVIGRVYRLRKKGLIQRAGQSAESRGKSVPNGTRTSSTKTVAIRTRRHGKRKSRGTMPPQRVAPPACDPVGFHDVMGPGWRHLCHWALWGDRDPIPPVPDRLYCGGPVPDESRNPWCAYHASIVYTPAKDREAVD